MLDTKKIREVITSCNTVTYPIDAARRLCDEVDRLRERENDRSAWGTGPEKLKAAKKEADQFCKKLRDRADEAEELQRMNSTQYGHIVHMREEEKKLREVIVGKDALLGEQNECLLNQCETLAEYEKENESLKRVLYIRSEENERLQRDILNKDILLGKMNDCILELKGEVNWLREKADHHQALNENQFEMIQELQKASQSPTRVGKVIDDQEKEIAELKAENIELEKDASFCRIGELKKEIAELKVELAIRTQLIWDSDNVKAGQRKEITELKAELQRRLSGADFEARKKLSEVIRGVVDEWQTYRLMVNGHTVPNMTTLNRVLNRYGVK